MTVSEERAASTGAELPVANEFADVLVRRVETRNGVRLSIRSPRRGTEILLDATELECLSWQTHEQLSTLFEPAEEP